MPQLDKFIIMSNIFWLFLFFSFILVFLSTLTLPQVLKSIRVRNYKLELFFFNIFQNINEGVLSSKFLNLNILFFFNTTKVFLNSFFLLYKNWVNLFKNFYN